MHENYLSVLTSGPLGWSLLDWATKSLPVSPLRLSLSPLPAQEHVKCLLVQYKEPTAFLFSSHWILKNRIDEYCAKLAYMQGMSCRNIFKFQTYQHLCDLLPSHNLGIFSSNQEDLPELPAETRLYLLFWNTLNDSDIPNSTVRA